MMILIVKYLVSLFLTFSMAAAFLAYTENEFIINPEGEGKTST